jgi:hypothetical protein
MNKITLVPAVIILVILFSSLLFQPMGLQQTLFVNANSDTKRFYNFQVHPYLPQAITPIETSVAVNETPPTIQWIQQYTANYSADYANRVIQTTDGGFAIAGIIGAHKYSVPVAWLVKTDSLGNVVWNQTFKVVSGNLTYNLESIAGFVQTKDGGYAIAGTEASFPSNDMAIAPSTIAILFKTDGLGNIKWNQTYSDLGGASFMIQTNDSGYALAGDYSLIKTNSLGIVEWRKSYEDNVFKPNTLNENLISMIQTTEGGYALLTSDNLLFKVNSSGDLQWKQTYQTGTSNFGEPSYINSFIQTIDGEYLLAGNLYIDNSSNRMASLIKADTTGAKDWTKTYGPSGASVASLTQTSDNGYAFAGTLPGTSNYPENLVWLVKTDSAGNLQWSQSNNNTAIGFSKYNLGGAISVSWLIETKDGGLIVAGSWNPGITGLDNAYYLAKTEPALPLPSPSPTFQVVSPSPTPTQFLPSSVLFAIFAIVVIVIVIIVIVSRHNRKEIKL